MSRAKELLHPRDFGQVNLLAPVIELEIADDRCTGRVFGANLRFAADEQSISLKEVGGASHVGWNDPVAASHAVDLHSPQNGRAHPLQLSRQLYDGRAAEAVAVDYQSDAGPLLRVETAVPVAIEGAPNQLERQMAFLVLHRFDPDIVRVLRPQFQSQSAHVATRVVPGLSPAQEPDDQDMLLLDRRLGGEVMVTLPAHENASCERQ